jgi:hypothetical protein
MTWALRASLLIVLEAHEGEWCTLAWLAGRVVSPIHVIRPLCHELASGALVQTRLRHGEPVYGMRVVADYPVVNDARDAAVP